MRGLPVWIRVSANWLPVGVGHYAAPAFADIDGDGDFDLAVGDNIRNVEYFENTGTVTSPIWTHRSSSWLPVGVGGGRTDPAFADIDNDGDFDLAVGDHGGLVEYFRNDAPSRTPGTFISSAIDTGQASDFTTLGFTISMPAGTVLNFQIRTAATSADLAAATWLGPDGTTATRYTTSGTAIHPIHDGHRWIQYKAFFSTIVTTATPRLDDITIHYQFFPTTSPSLISSPFDTTNPNNVLTRISWARTLPAGTATRFQVRTAPASAGPWTPWAGPCDGVAGTFATTTFFTDHTGGQLIDADMRNAVHDQWIQYRVWLDTTDTMNTPVLLDVTMDTDRTPPTVTINPVTFPTNLTTQTVTGTREAGLTVTMSSTTPGTTFGAVSYPTATTWSVVAALIEGSNNITATTSADAAGNRGTATATILRDTVAPTITINPVTSPTNLTTQTVTGTREAGLTITMSSTTPGTTFGAVSYPTATTWSVLVTLSKGSNLITATATDAAGNAASVEATIILDPIPPVIVETTPADGAINVPVDTNIVVTFSEAMDKATVEGAFSIEPEVPGIFTWMDETLTFNPYADLAQATNYTVTIGTGALDLAGNPMAEAYIWRFTTVEELPIFYLNLKAGWNMISLPMDVVGSPAELLPDAIAVFTWNAEGKYYEIPTELVPGKGYWVLVLEDVTHTIEGIPLAYYSLAGVAGWHMIGSVWVDAQVEVINGTLFGYLLTWDPVKKPHSMTEIVEPGKGYWLVALTPFEARVRPISPPEG